MFTLVLLTGAVIIFFSPEINSSVFLVLPALFFVLVIILYSVEIKRIILAKSSGKSVELKHSAKVYDEEKIQNCISEIIKATINMSKNDVGAILILSSGNISSQIIDSGVKLDSDISSELIESVFFPKTPLHDGAMIINDMKIVAAGCFLPLSQNIDNIPKDLGTRHRAGIGITETMDVVSIIVSEENGIISIAKEGKITRYADAEALRKTLTNYYWQDIESAKK
jgi:diadenylate cyclase